MAQPERSVLHVLPHPGGGGETYVDLLEEMNGYRFDRMYLGSSPEPSPHELADGVTRALAQARQHDLVHVHGDSAAILCLGLLALRPSIVTFNGLHLSRRLSGVAYRVVASSLSVTVRAANHTVCVCRAELDYLRQIVGFSRASRAVVIHNGVRVSSPASEGERARTRAELGIAVDDTVAIWVGSLDERKDPLVALQAAEHASVTVLVVGDGTLRREVERRATDTVRVLGQRSDVPRLLAASDVYLQTSHREGFALSLLEAMAAGLPAIVTDLPEHVEAISDTGICVALGDSSGLASALRRLAASPEERAELGYRASQRVTRLFGADEMVRRTRVVYDDAVA